MHVPVIWGFCVRRHQCDVQLRRLGASFSRTRSRSFLLVGVNTYFEEPPRGRLQAVHDQTLHGLFVAGYVLDGV